MKTTDKIKLAFAIMFVVLAFSTAVNKDLSAVVNATTMNTPSISGPTVNPTIITLGDTVSCSVSITGVSGVAAPTGEVDLYYQLGSGQWVYCSSVVLSSGQSEVNFSFTPPYAGTYQFEAVYSGDSNYVEAQSYSTGSLTVNQAAASISAFSLATSVGNSGVFVTASVTVSGIPGFVTPTNAVYFYVSVDGGSTWTQYDVETLDANGQATSTGYLLSSPGTYEFYVDYCCDSNYAEAKSLPLSLTWDGSLSVNAPVASPTSTIIAGAPSANGGETFLSATATGGSGQYTYQWLMEAPGASSFVTTGTDSNSLAFTAAANEMGNYSFEVVVTDQLTGDSVTSPPATIAAIHDSMIGMTVSGPTAPIQAGSQASFYATAYDQFGNQWDVTSQTIWSISNGAAGSWSSNVYTSATSGVWTVTGTCASTSCTITLTVNPGALSCFTVVLTNQEHEGNQFVIMITANDAFGNRVDFTGNVALSSSSFAILPTTATLTQGLWLGFISPISSGSTTITATDGHGHTGTSSLITVSSQEQTVTPDQSTVTTQKPTHPTTTPHPTQTPIVAPTPTTLTPPWLSLSIILAVIAVILGSVTIVLKRNKKPAGSTKSQPGV